MKKTRLILTALLMLVASAYVSAQFTINFTLTSGESSVTVPPAGVNVGYTVALQKPNSQVIEGYIKIYAKGGTNEPQSVYTSGLITQGHWTGTSTNFYNTTGTFLLTQSNLSNVSGDIYARFESTTGTNYKSSDIDANIAIGNNTITPTGPVSFSGSGDPDMINGSVPTGGSGSYSYQWQSSTTSATSGFGNISGATAQNYNPPAISQTTYYRRVVTSASLSNTSSAVSFTVNSTPITNNSVTYAGTTVFENSGDPSIITGSTPSGGTTPYAYQWQSSTTNASSGFTNIAGATSQNYDPSAIDQTTYYRRVVNSVSESNVITINVTLNYNFNNPTSWFDGSNNIADSKVLVGDVNGDGKSDVVRIRPDIERFSLYLNNGTSESFNNELLAYDGPYDLSHYQWLLGDVNGDAMADLVGIVAGEERFSTFLSTGTSFQAESLWYDGPYNFSASEFKLGDVNGDDQEDLIAVNKSLERFTVFLSDGSQFHAETLLYDGPYDISDSEIRVGDLNGDNRADVARIRLSDERFSVFLNHGTLVELNSESLWYSGPYNFSGNYVDLADVNGDGNDDIVMIQPSSERFSVFLSDGTAFQGEVLWYNGAGNLTSSDLFAEDVNADGGADVIAIDKASEHFVVWTSKYPSAFSSARVAEAPAVATEQKTDPLSIYPNPSTGTFNISVPGNERIARVSLHKASGEKISESNTQLKKSVSFTVDVKKGMYLIKVVSDKATYSRWVSIEK